MPQLEQTLFARGLGGSEFYKGAVNDLLSKVGTQGVLNRENLSMADEQLKLQQLAQVAGLSQDDFTNMYNLLGLSANTGLNEEQLASNRWVNSLPYLSTVKTTGDPLGGAIQGGLQALPTMNPWVIAASAGAGAAGNAGSSTVPYATYSNDGGSASYDWLKYLQEVQPQKAH